MLHSVTHEHEWNGVGIVGLLTIQRTVKEDLMSVSRNSDPVMSIELGLEEIWWLTSCVLMLHKWVVSRMKKRRFGNMDQELSETQDGESVIVGGYLN